MYQKKLRSCFPFVLFLHSLFLLLLLPVNISEYPGLLHVAPGPRGQGVGVVVLQHVAPDVVPGEKKAAMVKVKFYKLSRTCHKLRNFVLLGRR